MFSRAADDACVPDEELAQKLPELKCSNFHSCPTTGSAARFRESTNLMIDTGVMLGSR